ncbi:hypothetical protein [Mangrovimonas sp. ST2L15]|uniref:hypothetical protein n=1 Tax=Mangrovimonas sp. ST2L15 TaxID=1645916 RepID=UPI0006B5F23C|nr:hypothetical protein [Mangrovimonas sp. ST2L15]
MTKALKIVLISLGVLILLTIPGYFILQNYVAERIEGVLKTSLPETVQLEYQNFDLSLWNGTLQLGEIVCSYTGKHTGEVRAKLEMKSLFLDGIGFMKYLTKNDVLVQDIHLDKPRITYFHDTKIPNDSLKSNGINNLKQLVSLEKIKVTDCFINVLNRENDSLLLQVDKFQMNFNEVVMDDASIKEKIPVKVGSYGLSFKDLYFRLNDFENIEVEKGAFESDEIRFENLALYTKYDRETMNKMISKERDHYNLVCDSISVDAPKFGFNKDEVFYFNSPQVSIMDADLKVYRNKLLADNLKIKKLYSEVIRNFKFQLNLEEVLVKNANISYTEKVKAENKGGTVSYSEIYATIKKLGNTYKSPEMTSVNVDAKFFGKTPLKVTWTFDVNNLSNAFQFQADIGHLNASQLNHFTQPNMNIKVNGELKNTQFTINGNNDYSHIDLRIKYDDFDVVALRKDGKEKNKFLSGVLHVFVKNDSKHDGKAYRTASKDQVQRDKTKSVFNFIWKTIESALMKVMVLDRL